MGAENFYSLCHLSSRKRIKRKVKQVTRLGLLLTSDLWSRPGATLSISYQKQALLGAGLCITVCFTQQLEVLAKQKMMPHSEGTWCWFTRMEKSVCEHQNKPAEQGLVENGPASIPKDTADLAMCHLQSLWKASVLLWLQSTWLTPNWKTPTLATENVLHQRCHCSARLYARTSTSGQWATGKNHPTAAAGS